MNVHDHQDRGTAAIVCSLLLCCVVSCSCKRDRWLLDERKGKEELSLFLMSEMAKYGGSNVVGSVTPTGISTYVYSEDEYGFQIVVEGNRVATLQSLFQAHFGDPVFSRTNESGLCSFVYAVWQTGLAITCGLDSVMCDGMKRELTHFAAVKPEALR